MFQEASPQTLLEGRHPGGVSGITLGNQVLETGNVSTCVFHSSFHTQASFPISGSGERGLVVMYFRCGSLKAFKSEQLSAGVEECLTRPLDLTGFSKAPETRCHHCPARVLSPASVEIKNEFALEDCFGKASIDGAEFLGASWKTMVDQSMSVSTRAVSVSDFD